MAQFFSIEPLSGFVRRLRRYLPLLVVLGAAAAPGVARSQAQFEPPPFPADQRTATPGVRGLYDPSQAAAGPIGADNAPAATFVAPSTRTADATNGPIAPPDAQIVPTDAKPIEGSEIVARIEGEVVLASDVMWQVNKLIEMSNQPPPPEHLAEVQQMLLKRMVTQLIDTKLLFADFRRTVPAENLPKISENMAEPFEKTEIPRLHKMFGTTDRPALEEKLKQSGTSIKEVQRQWNEKMIAGEWIRQRTPKPRPVTHEEMLAYYQEHLKDYEFPAQVKWEELMARFDRCGGDRDATWKAVADMANEVWTHAAANPGLRGPVFMDVAKAKSHGFTAAQGGQHDWTTLGALKCEELNEALATLAVGQLSGPSGIESELGFHIVRVLERKDAGRTPFTEAQAKIKETLENEQREELINAELAKIRKTARVWTVWDGEIQGARLSEVLNSNSKR